MKGKFTSGKISEFNQDSRLDLMRQYRLLLKRRNESDSESESQPLMNSSCSSTKSFG